MKRWNWPTTILYIKHKKANLKQGCSKLVGKKRKAPTGGWSGGLNCPIGTRKKKKMHWHVPLPRERSCRTSAPPPGRARPRGPGSPGAPPQPAAGKPLPPRPGGVCTAWPRPTPPGKGNPTPAEPGTVLRGYPAEVDHRSARITAARLSPEGIAALKRAFLLPGVAFAHPSRCPGLRPPPGGPGTAKRSARQPASSPLV